LESIDNPECLAAAPFAKINLAAMNSAHPTDPYAEKVSYVGVHFVGIPDFQAIGTVVGQNISVALVGTISMERALRKSQTSAELAMKQCGRLKERNPGSDLAQKATAGG
jgi:sorbitol/mannitol transport system substrate-binding protein